MAGTFVTGMVQNMLFGYTAERICSKLRLAYLRAVMERDQAWSPWLRNFTNSRSVEEYVDAGIWVLDTRSEQYAQNSQNIFK